MPGRGRIRRYQSPARKCRKAQIKHRFSRLAGNLSNCPDPSNAFGVAIRPTSDYRGEFFQIRLQRDENLVQVRWIKIARGSASATDETASSKSSQASDIRSTGARRLLTTRPCLPA